MAELFLAQEPPAPGLVVLKRILPYLSEEPEFVQMFLDEARIAAQLHHPNIVQVYELGKLDNTIFIAMEFVEGIDLRRVVQEEGKFGANVPFGVAAAICAQVAAGLDYAHHSKGVDGRPLELIHRDVSPQNVMIGYDGRVKIVDFGIAKAGALVNRSKPGVIKGKFLYLSPEQVAQERLDHRADIFALGTMMYEITTGKSPFAKPTTEGILYAIRSEDPSPPHLLKDDYPTELSRIIMRCLVKDRNLRYQRASEVQADLEAFLKSGVLKQSTDISEYIARLMGEEEERTVLHIPIASSVGRKEATQAMTPGLVARPARRPTGEDEVAPPDFSAEPEPPTQMERPRQLAVAEPEAVDDDAVEEIDQTNEYVEEPEERTAVGNLPVGFRRSTTGESTVHERGVGRAASPSGSSRRSAPPLERDTEPRARRPQTPPSRRPLISDEPEEMDEEDDDSAQSISLTQPTSSRRILEALDEAEGASVSVTPPTTGQRRRLIEDDASSVVTTSTTGNRRRLIEDDASSEVVTTSTTGNRRRLVDDEGASVSVTPPTTGQRRRLANGDGGAQPTVNQRVSRQFARNGAQEEDGHVETESGVSELDDPELDDPEMDDDSDPTEGYEADPEDDESTAGYESDTEAPTARSRGFMLALVGVAVVVLLALGVTLYWALSSTTQLPEEPGFGPQPAIPLNGPKPSTEEALAPRTEEAPPSATPEGTPSNSPEALAAAEGRTPPSSEPGTPGASEPAAADSPDNLAGTTMGTEDSPSTEEGSASSPAGTATVAIAGAVVVKPAGGAIQGTTAPSDPEKNTVEPPPAKPEPPRVEVVFKASSSTLIRVNKKKVEANKVLSFAPGKLTVEWWCAHRRRRDGSVIKFLKVGAKDPYTFVLRCNRKSSR